MRIAVLLASFLAVPAFAVDALGARGFLTDLEVNTSSADTYLQYHGRIAVDVVGNSVEYRWGGTSCGSRVLTDAQVGLLQSALESGTPVTPRWVLGQGTVRCLIGFKVSA